MAKKTIKLAILSDELLAEAMAFRKSELWNDLDDSNIFAFKTIDGEKGYCCVMGNSGTHYSLGVYRGDEGLSTYLGMIYSDSQPFLVMNEMSMDFDCINIDFEDEDTDETFMTDETKDIILDFAKRKNIIIPADHGWPAFTRLRPAKLPTELTTIDDANFAGEALKAALEVAKKVKGVKNIENLGFLEEGYYAPLNGGKQIPLLTQKDDGSYEWSTIKTPKMQAPKVDHPDYTDDERLGKLDTIKKKGMWQCAVAHFYTPIMKSAGGIPYYPLGLFIANKASDKMIVPIMLPEEDNDNPLKMVDGLADTMIKEHKVPITIEVADSRTYALLEDFCVQEGINLNLVKKVPQVDKVRMFILEMMQKDFDSHEDDPMYS